VLVAAVLGPEQREDGELEVVRVAAEQLLDTRELPVGETEGTMKRLFRNLRQERQCSPARGWAGRFPGRLRGPYVLFETTISSWMSAVFPPIFSFPSGVVSPATVCPDSGSAAATSKLPFAFYDEDAGRTARSTRTTAL